MATPRRDRLSLYKYPEVQWLAENVRDGRLYLNLSQLELAERASLTQAYVSAVENMKVNATIEVLSKLAAALETTSAALLEKPEE